MYESLRAAFQGALKPADAPKIVAMGSCAAFEVLTDLLGWAGISPMGLSVFDLLLCNKTGL